MIANIGKISEIFSGEKINLIKDRILHGGYFSESDLDKLGI